MGISWSKRHHHHRHHHHHHHHHPDPPLPPPLPSSPPYPPLITLPPTNPPPPPPVYTFAANAPYSTSQPPPLPQQHPYPALPPPPPLPRYSSYSYNFSNYYSNPPPNTSNHNNVMRAHHYSNYRPYFAPPQISSWGPPPHPPPRPPPIQPVPYVDHQNAKKVKNDVNVHRDTIRLQVDDLHGDCHLVSFTFDALVDGSITIFYFAKEGDNCKFTPVYPEIVPVKIPFQKGLGQKFCQPSGTGVDLGFFDIDDLSKPVPGEDIYPLVISAESCAPSMLVDRHSNKEQTSTSPHAQVTQAVLQKKDDGTFQVKVLKQILWIDGVRYELREIFGISDSNEAAISDMESGKECIICMTEVKNTAVLPCRHMCMCSECAKELRLQSNKCPVCRQPIEELLEIKFDDKAASPEV